MPHQELAIDLGPTNTPSQFLATRYTINTDSLPPKTDPINRIKNKVQRVQVNDIPTEITLTPTNSDGFHQQLINTLLQVPGVDVGNSWGGLQSLRSGFF
jgi:hypothetical protein